MNKYEYFTKCLAAEEIDAELKAFGEHGWKLVYMEHHQESPNWFAIFIKEKS